MAHGPGKFDSLCTYVREQAEAQAAVVLVVNGRLGNGFSVQAERELPLLVLAEMLETVARQMRADAGKTLS